MAAGNLICLFGPLGSSGPATNYATHDTRNTHPILDFDAATDETRYWEALIPPYYSGGGIDVKIHWAASSATSGDVKWNAQFEDMSTLDVDSDSFAAAQTATGTANGTSGVETITTISFTNAQIDGIGSGDIFRFALIRDANDAGDTMTGDVEVRLVELVET